MSSSEDSVIMSLYTGEHCESRRNREMQEVMELLETIYVSSSSSEDSESENEAHEKCSNFKGTLDAMSEADFKMHMRLRRQTVEYLTMKYSESNCVPDTSGGGRTRILPKKSVYKLSNTSF